MLDEFEGDEFFPNNGDDDFLFQALAAEMVTIERQFSQSLPAQGQSRVDSPLLSLGSHPATVAQQPVDSTNQSINKLSDLERRLNQITGEKERLLEEKYVREGEVKIVREKLDRLKSENVSLQRQIFALKGEVESGRKQAEEHFQKEMDRMRTRLMFESNETETRPVSLVKKKQVEDRGVMTALEMETVTPITFAFRGPVRLHGNTLKSHHSLQLSTFALFDIMKSFAETVHSGVTAESRDFSCILDVAANSQNSVIVDSCLECILAAYIAGVANLDLEFLYSTLAKITPLVMSRRSTFCIVPQIIHHSLKIAPSLNEADSLNAQLYQFLLSIIKNLSFDNYLPSIESVYHILKHTTFFSTSHGFDITRLITEALAKSDFGDNELFVCILKLCSVMLWTNYRNLDFCRECCSHFLKNISLMIVHQSDRLYLVNSFRESSLCYGFKLINIIYRKAILEDIWLHIAQMPVQYHQKSLASNLESLVSHVAILWLHLSKTIADVPKEQITQAKYIRQILSHK